MCFSYTVSLNAVRVKYRKGTVLENRLDYTNISTQTTFFKLACWLVYFQLDTKKEFNDSDSS